MPSGVGLALTPLIVALAPRERDARSPGRQRGVLRVQARCGDEFHVPVAVPGRSVVQDRSRSSAVEIETRVAVAGGEVVRQHDVHTPYLEPVLDVGRRGVAVQFVPVSVDDDARIVGALDVVARQHVVVRGDVDAVLEGLRRGRALPVYVVALEDCLVAVRIEADPVSDGSLGVPLVGPDPLSVRLFRYAPSGGYQRPKGSRPRSRPARCRASRRRRYRSRWYRRRPTVRALSMALFRITLRSEPAYKAMPFALAPGSFGTALGFDGDAGNSPSSAP